MEQRDQRDELRTDKHHPLSGRRFVPRRAHRAYQTHLESLPRGPRRGASEQRHPFAGQQDRLDHHLAQGRLHRPRAGTDRGPADRRVAQARHQTFRRHQRRLARLQGERDGRGREGEGHLHPLPQDAQRRRVRRLHRRDPLVPFAGLPDGPSGQLRPRPHHRRLPPSGALRNRPPDRGQAAGPPQPHRPDDRGPHPPARGGRRADQGPEGDPHAGRVLRPGPEPSGPFGAGSRAVGLHGLPRGRQGAGRRRHVAGQRLVVPRHLHRVRPRARPDRRDVRTGAHRPVRHQAPHGPPPENAVLQRHLRRRPDVGDRGHRRPLQRRRRR